MRKLLFALLCLSPVLAFGATVNKTVTELVWNNPATNTDVTSIVPDPFQRDRYYMSTFGEGVFVYEAPARRMLARSYSGATAGGGGQ